MQGRDGRASFVRSAAERLDTDCDEVIAHLFGATGGPGTPADDVFRELDERIAREEVLPRLTDDLISEHEANPIGQHSDDLQRVLRFFRRRPLEGKLVIVETRRNERWCLARLPGERGQPPAMTGECFDDPAAAEHAIFRRRVEDLRDRFDVSRTEP